MKKSNKSFAGSLCAAVLVFAMILLSFPIVPASAEETTETTDNNTDYKYAVTIEFGPMTFYYDYGVWDTNEMRYKSGDASKDPANGTTKGYPGWYGFDGVANYISVKYSNANENDTANQELSVTLDYRALTTAETTATAGNVINGITMDFFSDKALTKPFVFDNDGKTFKVPHTPVDGKDKTVIYVSLRGVPTENGSTNNNYVSDTFTPIGMLTIRIGEISD